MECDLRFVVVVVVECLSFSMHIAERAGDEGGGGGWGLCVERMEGNGKIKKK